MYEFFQNSAIATIIRILGRGAGYLVQIFLARILAPENYGLYAIGWTILRLFSIAGHLGLDTGAIRFGSRYWQTNKSKFKSVILISISGAFISGLTAGLILYILSPWLSVSFFKKPSLEPILHGFAFTFPLSAALRVLAATSSISGKMLCGGLAEDVAQPIFQITLLVILINNNIEPIYAAVISTFFSYAIACTGSLVCTRWLTPDIFSKEKITLDDAAALFNYSIPTTIAVTLSSFNLWGDRLIVGYFGTERDTGIYQSISVITMLTTIVLSGVKITIAPAIAKLFEDQNLEELRTTSQSAVRWLLYLATPIIIVPVVAPREILELLYGWGYSSGALPLIWLSIGQFFYITFGICDQLFIMTGRNKDWLVISAGIFILTITLDAIAIPIAGLLGAAVVSCAMMLLAGIIALVRLKQKLKFWLINQTHTRIGLAGIVAYTITAILTNLAHVEALWKITSAGIVSITLFVAILLLFGIAPEDKKIFATVYKHIRR